LDGVIVRVFKDKETVKKKKKKEKKEKRDKAEKKKKHKHHKKHHKHHRSKSAASENESDEAKPFVFRLTATFVTPDGKKYSGSAKTGDTLLDVVINNDIPLDGFGACEGTLSCSTCHVVLTKNDYDKLEKPCEEELDMLDLAYGLTET
uniref:2Fe-2S ferredoxin-type domain-containing protein n=1 Tax=Soboliphyme baturini TaxID=241478 RepID=A0A183IWX5_9BILA